MTLSIFTRPSATDALYRKDLGKENLDLEKLVCSDGLAGKYSETNNVDLFITNEIKMLQTKSQQEANQFLPVRARCVEAQIEGLKDINLQLQKSLGELRSGNGVGINPIINLPDYATKMLDQVTEILNRRLSVGGEVTLAGTNSQSDAVVDLKNLPALSPGAGADFTYYQGGPGAQAVTIDGKDTIDITPVTAQDPGIELLVRALRMAKAANTNDFNDPYLISALKLTEQAAVGLSVPLDKIALTHNKTEDTNRRLEQRLEEITEAIKASLLKDGMEAFIESKRNQENLNISRQLDVQKISDMNLLLQQLQKAF